MKKRTFIRILALSLLSPAFLVGAVQASSVVEEPVYQDKLSIISTFQTAVLIENDDIGPDGLKRRGDGQSTRTGFSKRRYWTGWTETSR
jgi:hypothetical protein